MKGGDREEREKERKKEEEERERGGEETEKLVYIWVMKEEVPMKRE